MTSKTLPKSLDPSVSVLSIYKKSLFLKVFPDSVTVNESTDPLSTLPTTKDASNPLEGVFGVLILLADSGILESLLWSNSRS